MILILGGPGDKSAEALQTYLQRRMHAVARFDPDGFSGIGAISLALGGAGRLEGVATSGGRDVYIEDIKAVWSGRPGRFAANPILDDLWDAIEAPMLPGTPSALHRATHLLRQQRAANEAGFEVSTANVRPQMRVVVAGDKTFAVAVTSSTSPTPIAAYALPPTDAMKCRTLLQSLELNYATIDFATLPDNRFVFISLDPYGHFDDVEETTGMPVTRAVGEMLVTQSLSIHAAAEQAAHGSFTARRRHPSMLRLRKRSMR